MRNRFDSGVCKDCVYVRKMSAMMLLLRLQSLVSPRGIQRGRRRNGQQGQRNGNRCRSEIVCEIDGSNALRKRWQSGAPAMKPRFRGRWLGMKRPGSRVGKSGRVSKRTWRMLYGFPMLFHGKSQRRPSRCGLWDEQTPGRCCCRRAVAKCSVERAVRTRNCRRTEGAQLNE